MAATVAQRAGHYLLIVNNTQPLLKPEIQYTPGHQRPPAHRTVPRLPERPALASTPVPRRGHNNPTAKSHQLLKVKSMGAPADTRKPHNIRRYPNYLPGELYGGPAEAVKNSAAPRSLS